LFPTRNIHLSNFAQCSDLIRMFKVGEEVWNPS
jgi:hypothetical protein